MSDLPEGFVLDEPIDNSGLPEGFALDAPAPAIPQPKQSKLKLPSLFGVSKLGRVAQGAFDPSIAVAQMAGKGLTAMGVPYGETITDYYNQTNRGYEQERADAGQSGIDAYRLAGNIASPSTLAISAANPAAGAGLATRIGAGMAQGGAFGALTPVADTDENFLAEKGKQIGTGVTIGGAFPLVTSTASRLIMPKAAQDTGLQMLKEAGVKPTVGQSLGGFANWTEQAMTSIPIGGKKVATERFSAITDFNKGGLNKVTESIGYKVDDVGHAGVAKAKQAISDYYKKANNSIAGIKYDQEFADNLMQLRNMVNELPQSEARKFNKVLTDSFGKRLSPNGAMLPDVYKKSQGIIGENVDNYINASSGEQRALGKAFQQLESLMKQQARRSNPEYAKMIDNADLAYAKLARVDRAAKAAGTTDGIFTPAQLLNAIKAEDDSAIGTGFSAGQGLMQDYASVGQRVLGNTLPDSGTPARAATLMAATGAGGLLGLGKMAAAGAGTHALYTRPVQNALVKSLTERPESFNLLGQQAANLQLAPVRNALIQAQNQ